jgi:nitroreductase
MINPQEIKDIIVKRNSVRRYLKKEIDVKLESNIESIINQQIITPFNNTAKFYLVDKQNFTDQKLKLGTYGFISGSRYFIVGTIAKNNHCLEDFGFAMEQIILQLTNLGLGTCWLGGTFKRSEFTKTIQIGENHIIPAITPVGFPTPQKSFKEKIIKSLVKAKTRLPFTELFFQNNFETSINDDINPKYWEALEMVRLAPSAENAQPWRVVLTENNKFHFFLKRKKSIERIFPKIDLQKIDMGIAMSHFELFLKTADCKIQWNSNANVKFLEIDNMQYVATAEVQ